MNKKITIGNVCFIEDKENKKILLLKRKNHPMQGMCTGVGGKTKFDEDIKASCVREAKEETGLTIGDVVLRGVVKTILEGGESSWILFVYTATKIAGELILCPEGELLWVSRDELCNQNVIGFIKRILPAVMKKNNPRVDLIHFVEGTIVHDMHGEILQEQWNSCM